MKRLLVIAAGLVVVLAVATLVFAFQIDRFLDTPVPVAEDGSAFEIRPGTSFAAVTRELGERGIVSHPAWLRGYARYKGMAGAIHAGEWLVSQEPGIYHMQDVLGLK